MSFRVLAIHVLSECGSMDPRVLSLGGREPGRGSLGGDRGQEAGGMGVGMPLRLWPFLLSQELEGWASMETLLVGLPTSSPASQVTQRGVNALPLSQPPPGLFPWVCSLPFPEEEGTAPCL